MSINESMDSNGSKKITIDDIKNNPENLNKLTIDDYKDPEIWDFLYGDHEREVKAWLEENVKVLEEPAMVTLSNFDIDWHQFDGNFNLALDDMVLEEKVSFSAEASGKSNFSLPMFHSPLGAPASYSAYEITKKTHQAVNQALALTIPKLAGTGRHPESKKEITINSPITDRISKEKLKQAKRRVKKSYSITIALKYL